MSMTPEQTAELVRRTAKLMGTLLIARKDVKAIETSGGWIPEREPCPKHEPRKRCMACNEAPSVPFKIADFHEHLLGTRCLGTYLLDENSRVKFAALDFDLAKQGAEWWEIHDPGAFDSERYGVDVVGEVDMKTQHGNLEEALHEPTHSAYRWARSLLYDTMVGFKDAIGTMLGLPVLPVITGGGGHLLVPFGEPIPAREARALLHEIMDASGWKATKGDNFWRSTSPSIEIEVFPKQDTLSKGSGSFGNLIRLPLGWHRGAAVRTYFLDFNGTGPAWELPKAKSLQVMEAAAVAVGVEV